MMQVHPLPPQPATRIASTSTGGLIPQYFPPAGFEPFLPPRGRWEWVPDPAPRLPGCPSWPPEPTWISVDPALEDDSFVEITVTTSAGGTITFG